MQQSLARVTFVVKDYDEAILFFTQKLGFALIEDTQLEGDKRWVVVAPKGGSGTQLVHLFTARKAELAKTLATCRKSLAPDAAIWVSWPKKAAKVPTDITEDVIREVALPLGLVDIKVCAVDETWSGLKLVLRKELRDS